VPVDVDEIARIVGDHIEGQFGSPSIPALLVAPTDVLARAREVIPALVARAAYTGSGDEWGHWLALVEATGMDVEASIATLQGDAAYWLAGWFHAHDRDDRGLLAYERVLVAHLEQHRGGPSLAIGLNPYATLEYGLAAIRRGEDARALRALMPTLKARGKRVTDEILVALLRHRAGEGDRSAVQRVCARFARHPDTYVHVARAIALDAIGDREAGLAAIARFDRDTAMADSYRCELASRYGAAFDEVTARPRVKPPKRIRTPGFVLRPSRAKTPHVFAPAVPLGPACPDCGHPHRAWLSLDVTADPVLAPKLPGWSTFLATACLDCGAWMRRHDLRLDGKGAIAELEVEPGTPHAPFDDDATRAIAPRHLKLVKATKKLEHAPLEGQCQLGGDPAWIQEAVDVHCPACDAAMVFVARLSGPNGFVGSPVVAGDSGALYYFACGPCRRVAHIAQWT